MIDENQKFKISDTPYEGRLAEIGELTPYKSGNGFLRNLVIEIRGVFNMAAYVPVTVFGHDAENIDQKMDLGRNVKCIGHLTSRQYTDRSGNVRWALSMSASGLRLEDHPAEKDPDPAAGSDAPSVTADDSFMTEEDDLPF